MGEIINFVPKGFQKKPQHCEPVCRERVMLTMIRCYKTLTENEMINMMAVLCDQSSEPTRVQEAADSLPVLGELLRRHENDIREISKHLTEIE